MQTIIVTFFNIQKMNSKLIIFLWLAFSQLSVSAQDIKDYTWWNPAKNNYTVIEGQAWPNEIKNPYDRLPSKAEKTVRPEVWRLSNNAAGLMIRFNTSSPEIIIRYQVADGLSLPHMPATGASGVDLYASDNNGGWLWCGGNYSFGDTIQYHFSYLDTNNQNRVKGREYRLYLPLYNTVRWLEVGVPINAVLNALPVRQEKPLVVYGTSIAQGACASRPGMAWTAILERKLGRPLINLGFSGNGRLEMELTDLLAEIDAKMYILDCLPNLTVPDMDPGETKKRIIASVNQLQQKRKETPILLVEHGGYTDGSTNNIRKEYYTEINRLMKHTFAELKSNGIKNIYLLTKEEINLNIDCMVDGTHPTDAGMLRYAEAYERKILKILH